jgi:hypothetical protein
MAERCAPPGPHIVANHFIIERDNALQFLIHEESVSGHNSEYQIQTRYHDPMIPKKPSVIAGQVPAERLAGTPLPLNGTKAAVADGIALLAPPVPPPVRFAPLGYRGEFSQNKGRGTGLTPIGRELS